MSAVVHVGSPWPWPLTVCHVLPHGRNVRAGSGRHWGLQAGNALLIQNKGPAGEYSGYLAGPR